MIFIRIYWPAGTKFFSRPCPPFGTDDDQLIPLFFSIDSIKHRLVLFVASLLSTKMKSIRCVAALLLVVLATATSVALARENHIDETTLSPKLGVVVDAATPSVAQAFTFDNAQGGSPVNLKVVTLLARYTGGTSGTIDSVDVYDDAAYGRGHLLAVL